MKVCIIVMSSTFFLFASQGFAEVFTDDFETAHDYLTEGVARTGWDGFVGLGTDETADAMNASIDSDGTLYLESTSGVWAEDWSPLGPFLYKEVEGDFIASVYVADYSGLESQTQLNHNDGGLMVRASITPDEGGSGEDWICLHYFPIWSCGVLARYADDGSRTEDTGGDASAWGADRYLQVERNGNTFYLRSSSDGLSWTDYPDTSFTGLERADLDGLTLQVGLIHATYSSNTGYIAYDDFSLIYGSELLDYARDPSPYDEEDDVSVNTELSWTAGDHSQEVNGHQVFIGTAEQDVNEATVDSHPNVDLYVVSSSVCNVTQLDTNQPYYWRVDEVNETTIWLGDVWGFTTESGQAKAPYPGEGAVSIPNDVELSWTAAGIASSHDVYFGTDTNAVTNASRTNPLDVLKSQGQNATRYDPGALEEATEYFWRVDEVNAANTIWKGDTWSFTTTQTTGYYFWPDYSPTLAYDYVDEYGEIDPPTEICPDGVTGVKGTYLGEWWCFRWGKKKNSLVTEDAWIPMIERFDEDFTYITDIMRWPRDKRARDGYYSTVYLYGSGLSTDSASNTDTGGWQSGAGGYPMVLASYYPVYSSDPACPYSDKVSQQGAMIHEGIHCILSSMPGCTNACWFNEGGNTWLQGTMEGQRDGDFSSMGWLSAAAAIAPFMPIECYSGWLLDGSFGGPCAEGEVNRYEGSQQICTWRRILGGVQYGEAFPHALEIILGPESIAWLWRYCSESGRVLEDMAHVEGGLGEEQVRHLLQEYNGRRAFCDFGHWDYAYQSLLDSYWGSSLEEEWEPSWIDVEPWVATCYVDTTVDDDDPGVLIPEERTLPGWSGANLIPLTVDSDGTEASVTFNPIGQNMSCQLTYRDTSGNVHYGVPVSNGACSIPLTAAVKNNVIVAVICNTDYIYTGVDILDDKYDYTITVGNGITGTADIYTQWYAYKPSSYTLTATADENGTIRPSGAITIKSGKAQTFTFTPDSGYEVEDVILNGWPIGSQDSYTFSNVRGDYTISVTFVEESNGTDR